MKRFSIKGFTLIELLIVIGIIGILSGVIIAVINPTRMRNRAKDAVLKATMRKMGLAMAAYYSSRETDLTFSELPNAIYVTPCKPGVNNSFRVGGVETSWGGANYCALPPGGFYYYTYVGVPTCIGTKGFDNKYYVIDRNGRLKGDTVLMETMCENGLDAYPDAD